MSRKDQARARLIKKLIEITMERMGKRRFRSSHSDSLVAASLLSVSQEARMEFAKLERAYYGYWIGKLNCAYRRWNANLQSYFSSSCTGCRDAQNLTYIILNDTVGVLKYWEMMRIRIPAHHAVAVYLKEKSFKDGYIFDPWPTQSPMIYRFRDWPFSNTMKRLASLE